MRQSEHEAVQASLLKRLRESPGFDALVSLLMEWQRDVFQEFLGESCPEGLLRASVKGKVLQELIVLLDNRIEAGEAFARRQIEESRAEAERHAEEARFHEDQGRRRRESAFL